MVSVTTNFNKGYDDFNKIQKVFETDILRDLYSSKRCMTPWEISGDRHRKTRFTWQVKKDLTGGEDTRKKGDVR